MLLGRRRAYKSGLWNPNSAQKKRDERDEEDILSPCDLLLLSGRLVCDEALLTGESIPQVKEGIDMLDQTHILNLKDHQVAVISGGTKIMQHIPSSEVPNVPGPLRPTDKGCPAIVMRTAFSTTQGSLLRTILYGSKRVTANNAETGCFILILLAFAIAAASHLWVEGTKNPERSRYKLMLECTFILTSVVPPELPIQLSLAVNSSLLALSKLGLFCTEVRFQNVKSYESPRDIKSSEILKTVQSHFESHSLEKLTSYVLTRLVH